MFTVTTSLLLPHPPAAVARVVGRLRTLPRWCAGVRRVRLPSGALAPCDDAGCRLLLVAGALRLALVARTPVVEGGDVADHTTAPDAHVVRHEAHGDGVALAWSFVLTPAAGPTRAEGRAAAGRGRETSVARDTHAPGGTRLRVAITVELDPAHPTAAYRDVLCRRLTRRVPEDLARLEALLARTTPTTARPDAAATRGRALPA